MSSTTSHVAGSGADVAAPAPLPAALLLAAAMVTACNTNLVTPQSASVVERGPDFAGRTSCEPDTRQTVVGRLVINCGMSGGQEGGVVLWCGCSVTRVCVCWCDKVVLESAKKVGVRVLFVFFRINPVMLAPNLTNFTSFHGCGCCFPGRNRASSCPKPFARPVG